MSKLSFRDVLNKFRQESGSTRQQGFLFEQLMRRYLLSNPLYKGKFKQIWLWQDFPYIRDFDTHKDSGIDLVAQTAEDEYWAIQCKCYAEQARIDKAGVDSFLATSGKKFEGHTFSVRLWISTTDSWSSEAEAIIKEQTIPVLRIGLADLEQSAVDWERLLQGKSGQQAQAKTQKKGQLVMTHKNLSSAILKIWHNHSKCNSKKSPKNSQIFWRDSCLSCKFNSYRSQFPLRKQGAF